MRTSLRSKMTRVARFGTASLVATIALGIAAPEAAQAAPRSAFVVDRVIGDGGRVIRVNLKTGNQGVVSADPRFLDPYGIAWARSGSILVADQNALGGGPGDGAVFRVNPSTGNTRVVSSGNKFRSPHGIAVEKSGRIPRNCPSALS